MAGWDMSISGLASGFDWKSVVDQLTNVERAPQATVRTEQTTLANRRSALGQIVSQLTDLQTKATALGDSSLYNRRSVSSSDTTIASVSAADGAVTGSYSINVTTLATPSSWLGATSGIISPLHTADVSANAGAPTGPVLSAAGWGSTLTAGTVTIGVQDSITGTVTNTTVTVATTDTLKDVLGKLDTAIGSTGGATYSSANDQVTIARPSGKNLVLGSASDTSNLLSCLKLFTPASGASAVSDSKLGSLKLSGSLSSQPLVTPLTYKTPTPPSTTAETTGAFSINGVSIDYSSSSTLASVLNSINDSTAGVQASFDSGLNRIVLKNKEAGNRGVVLAQSDGGNFLTAFGLTGTGSSLSSGTDLVYSINGGATAKARSNTIKDSDSGLTGLTITASKVGTTTINSANDTGAARSAVDALVSSVNRVQSLISSLTVSNRDAAGKITAGVLAYDQTIFQLGSSLRGLLGLQLSGGPSTTIRGLADLGYSTTGYTNELTATNSATLNTALSSQLSEVQKFFSTTTTGLSARISTFVKPMVEENSGTLPQRQKGLTEQSSRLDNQLVAMERRVQSNRERLLAGFRAMEAAQAKSNSQMQFLNQKFGISS